MLATLRRDLRSARERDPAARNSLEVALNYSGVHAVWAHRFSHRLWQSGLKLPARLLSTVSRWFTGVEIHPGAVLGPGLFIDHAIGVVIGETAEVGSDVTMYHGATLGGKSLERGKRHPTVQDRVTIGAGAKILGPVTIGHDSRIGANAVVVKDVPPNSVVVGVPGQVVVRSRPRPEASPLDLDDTLVPDLVGTSLQALRRRVDHLEASLGPVPANGNGSRGDGDVRPATPDVRPSDSGVWAGEDFSI